MAKRAHRKAQKFAKLAIIVLPYIKYITAPNDYFLEGAVLVKCW